MILDNMIQHLILNIFIQYVIHIKHIAWFRSYKPRDKLKTFLYSDILNCKPRCLSLHTMKKNLCTTFATLYYKLQNFRIQFRSAKIHYQNQKVVTINDLSVKKFNRTYSVFNVNVTTHIDIKKVSVSIKHISQHQV